MNHFQDVWGVYDGWQRGTLIALMVASLVQTAFIVTFVFFRPWWRDPVGRSTAMKSSALLVILWLSVVNTFFAYANQEPVTFLAMWAVTLAITYQLAVLIRTPRRIHPGRGLHEDRQSARSCDGQPEDTGC